LTKVSGTSLFDIAIKFLVPFSYNLFIGELAFPKRILSSRLCSFSLISVTPSLAITEIVLAISHFVCSS